ncbi:MAG: S9 family peptidase [Zavarzinella sp.]
MRRLMTFLVLTIFLNPASGANLKPMTVDDLLAFHRLSDPQPSPDGKWVVFQSSQVLDVAQNRMATHLYLVPTDGSAAPRLLTSSGKRDSQPRWSPDGKTIAFVSNRFQGNQIFLLDVTRGGEAIQLTNVSTGVSDPKWSPDGKYLAFSSTIYPEFSELPFEESNKKNHDKLTEVEQNPVKARVFTKLFYRHWDEYVEDKRIHLFVVPLKVGPNGLEAADFPRDVTPGDRDALPTSSTFSSGVDYSFAPDSKSLVFTAVPTVNAAWSTNYEICRVTLDNRSTKWNCLTTANRAADSGPQFSPDGKKIAFRQQKKAGYEADKWDIVFADWSAEKGIVGPLTNVTAKHDLSVGEFIWHGNNFLFNADYQGSSPAFSIAADGTGLKQLPIPGRVTSLALSQGDHQTNLVTVVSSMHFPNEIFTLELDHEAPKVAAKNISRMNEEILTHLNLPKPESVTIDVEGGKMQMWLLKPPGFDPAKKWPVVYLVHGGPQGAWDDGWSFRWNPEMWAAQGYVIALPNPRGSTGFGQKFTDEISGDWGGKCYRDLMAGADYVEKLPYVDNKRIASAGASFGGYMQNWFAVNTNRFQCLINHCSVWNFESMWGTTDELWFDEYEHGGLPWEVPGKYAEFSPHKKAAKLGEFKTPMLIIHNDLDFRCPIGQGHELFSAMQRQGVPSRFINFPDEGHWVLKPANSKYWHKEVFDWLKKYVPAGPK